MIEHDYPSGQKSPPTREFASYCKVHDTWERVNENGELEYWDNREPYWFKF